MNARMKTPAKELQFDLAALKAKMKQAGESGADVARILGVTRQNICEVFHGRQQFSLLQMKALAEHYGLSDTEIVDIFVLPGRKDRRDETENPE